MAQKSLRWYETESPVLIVALLIIFSPLGLYSMWKHASWSIKCKLSVTGAIAALILLQGAFGTGTQTSTVEKPASESSTSVSTLPDSSATAPATNASSRSEVLGYGPTGYSLLKGSDGCIYVKGLTEADLARLNTDVQGFKSVIKEQTGSQCVFYE